MENEILEAIQAEELTLNRYKVKRDALRDKIRFCTQHKFQEEVRVAVSELTHFESVLYEYESFVKNLRILVKSYEEKQTK